MRLLHTTKLKIEEFVETEVDSYKYAILSHAWGEEEVTFQDMQGELPRHKKGFSKLENSCILAKKDGYDYIWIDTCCIDKTSSAELSEAINSMYRWYEEATVCYAYLSDVPSIEVEDLKRSGSKFSKSRWFERGWTLQELIAPEHLIFYCDSWSKLGTKSELIKLLIHITKIGESVLIGGKTHLSAFSIAQKMSWAAKRTTTRLEDRAYSLLGIFDVNMPLLYGEGKKAFIRLQEEILKKTDDDSLFAYQKLQVDKIEQEAGSLLAESLDYFSQSENVFIYKKSRLLDGALGDNNNVLTLVTNKGLQVHSFGCPCTYKPGKGFALDGWLMILDCQRRNDIFIRPAVFLKTINSGPDQFVRHGFGTLLMVREVDGKPVLDRWTDEPRFQKGIGFDKEQKISHFTPDFENIRERTIFVGADQKKAPVTRLSVMVREIIQPENRNFREDGWSHNWGPYTRTFGWNFGSTNSTTAAGQLIFEEPETGSKFVVVFSLSIFSSPRKVSGAGNDLQYSTWCTILELDRNTPSPTLTQLSSGPFGDLKVTTMKNKTFVAISAFDDGFIAQATLSREEFLGRARFALDVEVKRLNDEALWEKMRSKRTEIVDMRKESVESKGVLGYKTVLDADVLSITREIEKLLKD